MSASTTLTEHWPSVRALLITVVLAVHGLKAAPLPRPISEASFARPENREELRRWMGLVDALGIPLSTAQLKSLSSGIGGKVGRARWRLMRPLKPVFDLTGTGQGWALFATPDSHPQRLEVWIGTAGEERLVSRRCDADYPHLAAALSFRRVRGVYDSVSGKPKPTYRRFTRWVADRTFETFPEAEWVRVEQVRTHTRLPWERADPTETVKFQLTHRRPGAR
ncbi:MAG: hypothetical protein ACI8PZ_002507 [Myxococcota bacterium]|jgi:hypothetical protein